MEKEISKNIELYLSQLVDNEGSSDDKILYTIKESSLLVAKMYIKECIDIRYRYAHDHLFNKNKLSGVKKKVLDNLIDFIENCLFKSNTFYVQVVGDRGEVTNLKTKEIRYEGSLADCNAWLQLYDRGYYLENITRSIKK